MASRLFLDTNIILDYTLERKGELTAIENIFILGEEGKLTCSFQKVLSLRLFTLYKKNKLDGLSVIRELCSAINIIQLKKDILFFPLEKFKEIEDGLLYFIAANGKMNYFLTKNVKDFVFTLPSLPVITPTRFLKEIFLNDLPQ